MSLLCSGVNWTPSVIGCPVNIGSKVIEELHHRCATVLSCYTGRSRSLSGARFLKIRALPVQQPNDLMAILLSRTKG